MNETRKLAEARRFLDHLRTAGSDPAAFEDYLSAFLSAARSVLQYAYKEVRNNARGLRWYERSVRRHPAVPFLRVERNQNIHVEPVSPDLQVDIVVPGTVIVGSSGGLRHVDENGNVLQDVPRTSGGPPAVFVVKPDVNFVYRFDNWSGPEDVISLCNLYLDELTAIIADGQQRGLIPPSPKPEDRRRSAPHRLRVRLKRRSPRDKGE